MGNSESNAWMEDYDVEPSKGVVHEDWNVSGGRYRETPVTVFSALHPPSSRKRPYIENALQASKIYRHPGILRYIDGGAIGNEVYIVTEEATPLLAHSMEKMSLLQITAGLSSITEALVFLHDKAGVSHNNVCASNIYVTSDGVWKLWGLEYSCSFGDLSRGHIERIDPYCNERSIPPDNQSRISPAYQHSRDCYFLGKFIIDSISQHLDSAGDPMTADFLEFIRQKALHKEWSERPRLITFSDHSLFKHDFLRLRHDLSHILLQPQEERDVFIKSLPEILSKYSENLVASTLSSLLLSHTFFLIPSCASHLLPYLLKPRKSDSRDSCLFSESVFEEFILPKVLSLWSVRDASIRKVLLGSFEHYVDLAPKEKLEEFVLPELLLGIRDKDEELVAFTLRSLACLVPILGADVVVGKHREQIFSTAKPKVRSNESSQSLHRKKRSPRSFVPLALTKNTETLPTAVVSTTKDSSQDIESPGSIPERSSPDGGEMIEFDANNSNDFEGCEPPSNGLDLDEQWSDWEEMQDQPFGVLKVKTSDDEEVCEERLKASSDSQTRDIPHSLSFVLDNKSQIFDPLSGKIRPKQTTSMKLNGNKSKTNKTDTLGEEYDILSINIARKPDAEVDMFADLAPKLQTRDYNLESMLMEASQKSKEGGVPSVSNTLALLDIDDAHGDDWNVDEVWGLESSTCTPEPFTSGS